VTGLAAGGDGIGRLADGRVVFCEGALPGERVRARLTADGRDFARAGVLEVLEASSVRVAPPCPELARGCGGCTWQHVRVTEQLALKVGIVADALRRLARLPDAPVSAAPPERGVVPAAGYRTSVRLAVDPDGRPSYRRRHGHEPVAVRSCRVAHPRLAELITDACFPGAREVALRVGASSGERVATPDRAARRAHVPADVAVSRPGGRPPAVHEQVATRRWRISAGSFFQSGPAAAGALVEAVDAAVGAALGPGGRLLDLYAGVGLLGGSLVARRGGAELVAVESGHQASRDAAANLADLGARVVREEALEACRRGPGVGASGSGGPDVVVADPARSGLGPSTAAAVAALGAPVLVLVSCDAASLARDVTLLAGAGYRLDAVEVLDLFPGTFHVEAVSRLVRRPWLG